MPQRTCAWIDWYGCYDDSWKDVIVPPAFAHPAKFSRGLIERIVQHGIDQGYWIPGKSILADPFAGIATGGIVCASKGLRWIGVELEKRFVELANQNFALHYTTWQTFGDPQPMIVLGNSREFAAIVGEICGVVTSPPYAEAQQGGGIAVTGTPHQGTRSGTGGYRADMQGTSPGQIGSLPAGSVDGVVTSPPFASSDQPCASQSRAKKDYHAFTRGEGTKRDHQMKSEQNIAGLPEGTLDAAITSPPYAESISGQHGEQETAQESRDKRQTEGGSLGQSQRHGGYGVAEGQIGSLKEGDLEGVITSPPYEDSGGTPSLGSVNKDNWGKEGRDICGRRGLSADYGKTEGQIGRDSGQTYWQAVAEVYRQMWLALKPGGVAAIVVKSYVKQGKIVDLPGDTVKLLEALGFDVFERTRCWLVKTERHPGLFGEDVVKKTERKSFFRRLTELKAAAGKFWPRLSRAEQASSLWQARVDRWANYYERLGEKHPAPKPSRQMILGDAMVISYRAAGSPDVGSPRIDYEETLWARRAKEGKDGSR